MTDEQKLKIANAALNAATRLEILQWKKYNNMAFSKSELKEAEEAEPKAVRALLEVLLGRTATDEDLDQVNVGSPI